MAVCFLRSRRGLLALTLASMLVPIVAAQDAAPTEDHADAPQIAKWIKQLDSDRFAERTDASRHLGAAGKAACPALAEAAIGGTREVSLRAIDILRSHLAAGDQATKEAAREALKKIAASDDASAARRAKDVLNPKPVAPPAVLPVNPFGQQIQIQVNAAAGRQVRRVRIANGVKEIEVEDGGRKVKITENPAGGIQMEVKEKKNGKETTEKYSAKNADELKKKHPEAHKIYQKYAKQVAGGIQIRAVPVPAGAVPLRAIAPRQPVKRALRKTAADRLKTARHLIEITAKQLRGREASDDDAKKLKESAERLEGIAEKLKQEEAELGEGP